MKWRSITKTWGEIVISKFSGEVAKTNYPQKAL